MKNFVDFLIPAEKRFVLKTDLSPDELVELLTESNESSIVSKVEGNEISIAKADLIRTPLHPTLTGSIRQDSSGTRIVVDADVGRPVRWFINAAFGTVCGTLISFAACLYLHMSTVALFYTTMSMLGSSLAVLTLLLIICSMWMRKQVPTIVEQLTKIAHAEASEHTNFETNVKRRWISQQTVAVVVSSIIYLLAAYGLHSLAWQSWCEGNYVLAEQLCQPVAKITETVLGQSHPTTADCRYYVAECYRCEERLQEAADLYRVSLANIKGDSGYGVSSADIHFNLARVLERQGEVAEAMKEYQQAIHDWEQVDWGSADNMLVARPSDRLALVLMVQKRFVEAERLAKRALKIDESYGSNARLAPAYDLNDLGVILMNRGRYAEAEKLLRKSLSDKEMLNADRYSIATTSYNLAQALKFLHQGQEAQKYDDQARTIWSDILRIPISQLPSPAESYRAAIKKYRTRFEVPYYDSRADALYPNTWSM